MLATVLRMRGGVTAEGLKENRRGRKLYDFIANCFSFRKPHPITGMHDVKTHSHVLFFREHQGPESASILPDSFNSSLEDD